MSRAFVCVVLTLGLSQGAWADEATPPPVFSGPQLGERLAELKVRGIYGDQAGRTWDLVQAAKEQPVLLVFLHQRTRPVFGMARGLMTYVAQRKDDKLTGSVIWLTDDATEAENWLKQIERNFPKTKRMPVVLSTEGVEGPGAYGLNRNVAMTVLVADKNRVTANFALVQPSLQADLPKIIKAVIGVAGGEMPKLSDLEPNAGRKAMPRPNAAATDEKLTGLLRELIQKDATNEQVDQIAQKIEAHVNGHPAAKTQLVGIVTRIQNAGKLANYGTAHAQKQLSTWAKKFGPSEK